MERGFPGGLALIIISAGSLPDLSLVHGDLGLILSRGRRNTRIQALIKVVYVLASHDFRGISIFFGSIY